MKKTSKSLTALLVLSLFFAFTLSVHAESVTGDVYSEIQIVDLAVQVTPGDKQLTVTFPKRYSEGIDAVSFEITIQNTKKDTLSTGVKITERLPAPVKIAASSITTGLGSYTFKNLTNKSSYAIQVTAYNGGEIVAQGTGIGVPAVALLKIDRVVALGGDSLVKIAFNKLTGKGPYDYKIKYWTQNDAKGNPIILTTITVKTKAAQSIITHEFKMLNNGTTYHFDVFAETKGEVVAITSDVTATPKAKEKRK